MSYDGGDVAEWQARLRPKVRELIGFPDDERIDLNPQSLWKRDHPYGTIEKLVLHSEPGSDILAYLCLPTNATPPYPFFICVQGHTTGMHHSIAVERDDNSIPMQVRRRPRLWPPMHGTRNRCFVHRATVIWRTKGVGAGAGLDAWVS